MAVVLVERQRFGGGVVSVFGGGSGTIKLWWRWFWW